MEAARHPWPALGALLVRDGLVDREDLDAVLAEQSASGQSRISGKRLGEALVDRGLVTSEQVARLVAEQYELPFVELDEVEVNLHAAAFLPAELSRRLSALPISVLPDDSLLVVVADPTDVLRSDELRRALGRPLRFAVAAQDALGAAISFAAERMRFAAEIDGETADEESSEDDTPRLEASLSETESRLPVEHPAAEIETPRPTALPPALGTLLVRDGVVSEEEVEAALAQQRISGSKRLGEILVERGSVTRAQVAERVAEQYELSYVELAASDVEPKAAELLSEELARRHTALPVRFLPDDAVLVAIADPTNSLYADELRSALDVQVEFVVAAPNVIEEAIASLYGGSTLPPDDVVADDIEPAADEAYSEKVDETIRHALALGASDVHFTPQSDAIVVRARVDGVMRELEPLPISMQTDVSNRLKKLAHLDADDRRSTQTGHAGFHVGESTVDLRIVVLPTKRGEKVTVHVLHHASAPGSLADLGMASDTEEAFRRAILRPAGLVLVAGRAESGRTTTLYAALQELNTPERTILTIEDPVEHLLPGVDQTEVDEASSVSFASGLRAILRSDPDVVVVGEVGDRETAETVLRAALAGRLVLSSVHAEGAVAAVRHLVGLGVEPDLVGTTLSCVVVQRLVRSICPDCRESYYATAADLADLERPSEEAGRRLLARENGCANCGWTGFKGRVAIFEALVMTERVRDLLVSGAPAAQIQEAAIASGMRTLREEGIRLCLDGITTAAELRRVAGDWAETDATATRANPASEQDADAETAQA
jgi:type IV pilus assembly protein PilB